MYLARKTVNGACRYVLRESYAEGAGLLSRDLFDLGADPGRFIVYPGGRAYYIDETVTDRLSELKVSYDSGELDRLFLPFLDPELRWKMQWITDRRSGKKNAPIPEKDTRRVRHHLFDKYHYLEPNLYFHR